jgi:hypothetical protein
MSSDIAAVRPAWSQALAVGWPVSFNRDKINKRKGKRAQSKLTLKERVHGPTPMTYSRTWLVPRTQLMRPDRGHQNQLVVWSPVTLRHIWGRGAGIDLSKQIHDLQYLLPDIPSPYRSREARSDGKTISTSGDQEGPAGDATSHRHGLPHACIEQAIMSMPNRL